MGSLLKKPIFTPATKAESGHDQNLTEEDARAFVGESLYEELRDRSVDLYVRGAEYAAERGVILADTKFEFWIRQRPRHPHRRDPHAGQLAGTGRRTIGARVR